MFNIFPRIPDPRAAQLHVIQQQLARFERLSPQEQNSLSDRQFAGLRAHASRHSSFWRERLKKFPDRVPLQELPPLTRAEIQQHGAAMRARIPGMNKKSYREARTSGSTGQPVVVDRFAPVYQLMYQVLRLARLALADGRRVKRFEQVITFSEVVTSECRAMALAAFVARIVDRYSCEEMGWIAFQCPKHEHYHAFSATAWVEIVDDSFRPVKSDANGMYAIPGLLPGLYYVGAVTNDSFNETALWFIDGVTFNSIYV